jgi:hypothetical protein
MMKMTPTVDDDDEHYTAPLQATSPRRDDDEDDPRQAHGRVRPGTKEEPYLKP